VSDERDTRVEELHAGDQVRYLGEWFDVVKVRQGLGLFPILDVENLYHRDRRPKDPTRVIAPYVAVSIDDPGRDGRPRELFWIRGSFVAAECNPRAEDVSA
jgi:hypothetical protein